MPFRNRSLYLTSNLCNFGSISTSSYRRHFCDTSRWSKIYEAGH
jgi:hypothetical protein